MEAGLQAWEIIEGIDISLNSRLLSTALLSELQSQILPGLIAWILHSWFRVMQGTRAGLSQGQCDCPRLTPTQCRGGCSGTERAGIRTPTKAMRLHSVSHLFSITLLEEKHITVRACSFKQPLKTLLEIL